MKFTPATSQTNYIKLAVYASAGQGKSILALSAPGKKLVVDTEGGCIPYASLTSFDVLHTQSFGEIKALIDDLTINPPKDETTLVIDSASIIWASLQQAMLEKKMAEKGIVAMEGTEKVQFAMADWAILKRWNADILSGLMALKCHVVCTFREAEVRDEHTFKGTGEFVPQWEKNTAYTFSFVGRINDRSFTFKKGRLAQGVNLVDLAGKKIALPTIATGDDLPKLWEALFGAKKEGVLTAAPAATVSNVEDLKKDPEAVKIAHEIRSSLLPKYGISNSDFEMYCKNKIMQDGASRFAVPDEDGKIHLSSLTVDKLRWVANVINSDASRMSLLKRIEDLRKEAK